MSELKTVVVLDGAIINVGEWDYQIELEVNQDNETVEVAHNPLPDGATIEQREMLYSVENGWQLANVVNQPSAEERLNQMEALLINLLEVL